MQRRRPAHLLQARAHARALLLNIEDLIRYDQPRAHESGSPEPGDNGSLPCNGRGCH